MKPRPQNDRGVCLTELMISLTTGAIVLAASLQTFNVLHAQTIEQQRKLAQQQDLRLGMEVFEQEVRLAAPDSIVMASPQEFHFLANINAQQTTVPSAVMPGQTILPVLDGSGWAKGKTVMLCGTRSCEEHRLLRDGQLQQLTLLEPLGATFPAGSSVEVTNRVVYYTKPDERGLLRLMRMIDGGANVLVGELEGVRLSYWDEQGRPAQVLSMIRRVAIEMNSSLSPTKTIREVSLRS